MSKSQSGDKGNERQFWPQNSLRKFWQNFSHIEKTIALRRTRMHWIYLIASRGWNLYQLFRLAHSFDSICLWLPEEQKSVNVAATRQPSWPYIYALIIGLSLTLTANIWVSFCRTFQFFDWSLLIVTCLPWKHLRLTLENKEIIVQWNPVSYHPTQVLIDISSWWRLPATVLRPWRWRPSSHATWG